MNGRKDCCPSPSLKKISRTGWYLRSGITGPEELIELMSHIVAELTKAGMSDQWILKNIGMDKDELLRLKQVSGLAELFANKDFSISDEL